MNRKIVIICTVLALLLLGGIGFGFYKLFFTPESEGEELVNSKGDAMMAIPSDVIMVYDFASFDLLAEFYDGRVSPLASFLKICPPDIKNEGAVVSVHYPSKNTIAPLLVVSVEDGDERSRLKDIVSDYCSGVINKKYSGVTISKAVVPAISYTFYGKYLIASPSHVTVESSIRHLESRTSIKDNQLYQKGASNVKGKVVLHINHQNIGKFFSGSINYDYLGKATFFSSLASWSSFNLDTEDATIDGDGKFINVKDEANFSNIFLTQKGRGTEIFEVLPHNTEYVISLQLSDVEKYLESYTAYLEAIKKINDYHYLNSIAAKSIGESISPKNWFMGLDAAEIAVASIPDSNGGEKMTFIRVKNSEQVKLYKGYISTLLGNFFAPASEEAYGFVDDWMVVGSKRMVDKLCEETKNELYFSMKMYLDQTSAASVCKGNSTVVGVVNLSKCADSLALYFKKEYSAPLLKGMEDYNFNYLTFNLINGGGSMSPHFTRYAENMAVLPQPPVAEIAASDAKAVYDETVVVVPEGPFEVKNFVNGKKNYLQQLGDNKIRLLDENKRGVWTIPFGTKISGYVAQVDHFKNDKLQMIFCSDNKLYMLDRLGRWVKPYPVTLSKNVLLGPRVYDFNKTKEYTLVVLHTDNTIGMYDMNGKALESWTPVQLGEKIKGLPELMDMDGARYWVIRTGYQTIICNENGSPVADFSKKRRLTADTKVEKTSGKEVVVMNMEGKEMVLNLQTGAMKKK